MRKLLSWFSIFVFAALSLTLAAQDQKKTSAPKKKTASARTTKKSSATKAAAPTKTGAKSAPKKSSAKKSAAKKSSKSARKAPPRTTWRNRQTTPTPERYKQIQDALVAKGFLDASQASGEWGQSSADALKRFQAAQNIQSTGKIDSLSLIALGLGPKHDDAAAPPKPPESPPQAP